MKFNNTAEVVKFLGETKGAEGRPVRQAKLDGNQWTAWKQVVAAANNIIGEYENMCMDEEDAVMPSSEEIFDEIFDAVHNQVNASGYTNYSGGLKDVKFAGNTFIKGAIEYKMSVDGYSL